jgi:6-pyruvoyltetrahydropterin/6-carboxytetrahydropterin synthase
MMYSIGKEFSFSAAHRLNGLSMDHPCSRLHGHNYVVQVEILSDSIDTTGFVLDYRELDCFKEYLDENVDHQYLNEVYPEFNPTAENLAKHFYLTVMNGPIGQKLEEKYEHITDFTIAITVSETPKTVAAYTEA